MLMVMFERATRYEGVGAWIQLRLARPSRVGAFLYTQRFCSLECFKDVELQFNNDGRSTQLLTLPKREGPEFFGFDMVDAATSVRIEVLSVYDTYTGGFQEVAFYGVHE